VGRLKAVVTAEAKLTSQAAQCVNLISCYGGNALPKVFNLLDIGVETSYEAELVELEHRLKPANQPKPKTAIEILDTFFDPPTIAGQERGA